MSSSSLSLGSSSVSSLGSSELEAASVAQFAARSERSCANLARCNLLCSAACSERENLSACVWVALIPRVLPPWRVGGREWKNKGKKSKSILKLRIIFDWRLTNDIKELPLLAKVHKWNLALEESSKRWRHQNGCSVSSSWAPRWYCFS